MASRRNPPSPAADLDLLSTHISADFDAFASVLAARKLYPEAEIFFPGSREESVRRMEDEASLVRFEELRQKQIDPRRLRRLILCDTRQRDRIGVLARWLEKRPEIEVLIYDHHPDSESDLAAAGGLIDPGVGCTATLLVEELRRRGLPVTPAEATVLSMGIHEDTGSLTYATTAPRDCQAAAWLLSQGADLASVRRWAVYRLDAQRLEILHRMTRELTVHRLHDHRVGVVALALGEFVDELAPLVSRVLEIFELPLLFAVFGEEDRVSLIARGQVPGVDLGQLLAEFAGGGGHATAASARIKDQTVLETRERLLAFLREHLPPAAVAADLMIRSFFRLPASTPVAEAKARLVERRVNAAPVVDPEQGNRPVGWVSRQILDAALQHDLGRRPVARVMTPDLEWVAPEAPSEEVARRLLERRSRFVLVGEEERGEALGLITRMEVLGHLYGRLDRLDARLGGRFRRHPPSTREVSKLLSQGLAPALRGRIDTVAALSREHGVPVYLVGGLVRDLLLGRENRDVDLVVEGDGIQLARWLAEALGGRVRAHEAFLTAVVVDRDGFHIDVATARSEFYRSPAALPEVASSTLRQDLYRRDFTVNTLAIRLGPQAAPELIDHFGGRQDLETGHLRVLHSLSFVDDPTRALRAVRLELRLGLDMSPETRHLLSVALEEGVFERLSGSRLRDELTLLLEDLPRALRAVERLAEVGLLPVLHPRLDAGRATLKRLDQARSAHAWYVLEGLGDPPVSPWRLMLLALVGEEGALQTADLEALAERLMLSGDDLRLLIGFRERLASARQVLGEEGVRPHQVSRALAPLAGEELLVLMALSEEPVRSWVRRDLTELRRLELTVRGRDLLAAGYAPGPALGEALEATRDARLDGLIGPGEELDFAAAELRRRGAPHAESPPRRSGPATAILLGAALAGALLGALAGSPPLAAQVHRTPEPEEGTAPPTAAPAIRQVLRMDCGSSLGRRDVALFSDGVIRLREGPPGEERLTLHDLDPDRLEGFLTRLSEEAPPETGDLSTHGPGGQWVESCRLVLDLAGREKVEFSFGRYDALSLPRARLVSVARELGQIAEEALDVAALPPGYEPRPGDVLERRDGVRFRVARRTGDGGGVELQGIEQPLTVYIPIGAIRGEFVALLSREER